MSEKFDYKTSDSVKRAFADRLFRPFNLYFYIKAIHAIVSATKHIKKDTDFYPHFVKHCEMVLKAVEATGAKVEYSGLENIPNTPCIFIGNHISTLETLTLGHVLKDKSRLSFVIKESLMKYPYFNRILANLGCITVTRTNPVADLKKLLKDGPELISKGISIVIFPQHTRGFFHPDEFSTIGCKIARKTNAPIVPLALDTRFWSKGKIISDFGPIHRDIPVRFAFGKPLIIDKNEKEIHAQCLKFIGDNLEKWGVNPPQSTATTTQPE